MLGLCEQLVEELWVFLGFDCFGFIVQYCGMFSQIGMMFELVEKMCVDSVIYMVSDSCMNIVGLNDKFVLILVKVIVDVGV